MEQQQSPPAADMEHPESAAGSVEHGLAPDAVATDVETLAALGNDTRYDALRRIAQADDGVCVCELEPELGVSQGAVSQALSRLFSAGLVERRKEGRWRYYTATERTTRIFQTLDDTRRLIDDGAASGDDATPASD